MTNISIIVHGKHGPNSLIRSFCEITHEHPEFSVELHLTQYPGHAKEIATESIRKGNQLIITSGGDGTVNEVVNGIITSENREVRLLIIPAGTGNDFMRPRSKFTDAYQIMECIQSEQSTPMDVGMIVSENKTYFFLNIADAGFGGTTVHTLNRIRKVINGKIAYPLAILRTFLTYRKPTIELKTGEFHYSGPVLMVAFCNGSCFGNGIYIHPDADPTDGKLNITLLGQVSLFDYIRYLPRLKKGVHISHPELHYLQDTACSIQLTSGKLDIEADGEIVTLRDPEISILPGALRFVGPNC